MKYIFVVRDNKTVVDIPEKDLHETLKRHPTWRVISGQTEPTPQVSTLACPLCGFEAKSEFGLRSHKRIKHS